MLTKYDAFDCVRVISDLESHLVLVSRPHVMQDHRVVRIANHNDISALACADAGGTSIAHLDWGDRLRNHGAGILVHGYVATSSFQACKCSLVGIELLHYFLRHKVINHKVAIVRNREESPCLA